MGRPPNWWRDLVAKVMARTESDRQVTQPAVARRHGTAHAREYRRLNKYPFPPEYYTFTCGARTRAGTPCKRHDLYPNGRCKFHGGMSTGPKTPEGRWQSAVNGRRGGRPPKKPEPMGR